MKKVILEQLYTSADFLSEFQMRAQGFVERHPTYGNALTLKCMPEVGTYCINGLSLSRQIRWRDQRDIYSVGFSGKMLGTSDYFYFPHDSSLHEERFCVLKKETEKNAREFFCRYKTVRD